MTAGRLGRPLETSKSLLISDALPGCMICMGPHTASGGDVACVGVGWVNQCICTGHDMHMLLIRACQMRPLALPAWGIGAVVDAPYLVGVNGCQEQACGRDLVSGECGTLWGLGITPAAWLSYRVVVA